MKAFMGRLMWSEGLDMVPEARRVGVGSAGVLQASWTRLFVCLPVRPEPGFCAPLASALLRGSQREALTSKSSADHASLRTQAGPEGRVGTGRAGEERVAGLGGCRHSLGPKYRSLWD